MTDTPPTNPGNVNIHYSGPKRGWGIYRGPIPGSPPPLPPDTSELPPGDPGEGPPTDHPEDREKKDCAAHRFQEELPEFGKNVREYISLIYRQNGRIYGTPIATMNQPHITDTFFRGIMSAYGIGIGDLLGWSHNHNRNTYCTPSTADAQRENQWPSVDDIAWRDRLIREGAPEAEFVIYTLGCNG